MYFQKFKHHIPHGPISESVVGLANAAARLVMFCNLSPGLTFSSTHLLKGSKNRYHFDENKN